jgi:DNA-binding response OmpR family regulator
VQTHEVAGGQVDFSRREIRFEDGEREELSKREAELLRYLVAQCGRAVTRDELLRQVWGLDPKNIETRTVDMHVAHLRQKLRSQNAVVTVRGKGYMIAS